MSLNDKLLQALEAAKDCWRGPAIFIWQDYPSNIPGSSMRYGSFQPLTMADIQGRVYTVYLGDDKLAIHWNDAYYDPKTFKRVRYPWI